MNEEKLEEKGVTLVPLELHAEVSRAKLLRALAKGKPILNNRRAQLDEDDKRAMNEAACNRR